jgi:hypothetical protein
LVSASVLRETYPRKPVEIKHIFKSPQAAFAISQAFPEGRRLKGTAEELITTKN